MTKTLWPFVVALACGATALQSRAALHYVNVNSTNATRPYTNWATAASNIQDAIDVAMDGDEVVVTNGVYETGGRVAQGALTNRVAVTKLLSLYSVNGPNMTVIRGHQVPGATNGDEAVRCAYLTDGASLTGFTLTGGATRIYDGGGIEDAIGGGVRCNGVFSIISNCVITSNSASLQGGGAYNGILTGCILSNNIARIGGGAAGFTLPPPIPWSPDSPPPPYLAGMTLENCTVANNSAFLWGGGGYGASLNNCIVRSNSAQSGGGADYSRLNRCTLTGNNAEFGGGASGSSLTNCALTGNWATSGGGAGDCQLDNSTLVGNSATLGGGAFSGTLNNCIAYYNAAFGGENYLPDLVMNSCCTTPLPLNGQGNSTQAPLFVDSAAGDLRLQSNSPCINAGRNAFASPGFDLDGNPRIAGGTVDIGAYEYQSPQSTISYAWLQQYGLPTDGAADFDDPDHDGHSNWQEWRAGTQPFESQSALQLLWPSMATNGVVVRWQSEVGRLYFLERRTNLAAPPQFELVASNLVGQAAQTGYLDSNAVRTVPSFYRVGVQE